MSICGLFSRQKQVFDVVVHLNGRHPYLRETHLDYESKDVTIRVVATNWNKAESVAMDIGIRLECWSVSVKSITRVVL